MAAVQPHKPNSQLDPPFRIIIIIRLHLFKPQQADQMPGHHEMGQLLEHRPCLSTH